LHKMGRGEACVVLCLVLVCVSEAVPTITAEAELPPPVRRRSTHTQAAQALIPNHAPHLEPETRNEQQSLVQASQTYVDSDGDTHIASTTEKKRPARGLLGSTEHLKDDQFFLNVPFSQLEFNAVVEVTWVRPPAQMSKLDYIGLYTQGDADDAIPCNWEFAPGEEATGKVSIQMTSNGEMELRYYDAAANRPRVRLALKVFAPCANNCTNHGICEKGACVCFSPYKGEQCCEVGGKISVDVNATTTLVGGMLHVEVKPPVGNLDKRNWIGLFHANADSAPSQVSTLQAAVQQDAVTKDIRHELVQSDNATVVEEVEYVNTTLTPALIWRYVNETLDLQMPFAAGQYILKVVKNIEGHPVLGKSGIIYVHNECPNECSGHGVCVNGTCHCDQGYDQFPDCSIGDGMVALSVSPTECLVGSALSIVWERNSDGGFSNLDYLALFDQNDTSFDAPFAYQFAQAEDEKVDPTIAHANKTSKKLVDRGKVEFSAPFSKSSFVVRYFRKDHIQYGVSDAIETYFDCASPNCSNHGVCNKGLCKCSSGWKGSDCSIGDGPYSVSGAPVTALINTAVEFAWSRPVKVGSIYDFIGLYAERASNDEPLTYRYADRASNENSTDSVTLNGTVSLQLPPKKGLYEARYIDAFTRETKAVTSVIDCHLPCPNACSGHGTCLKDVCQCTGDWTARDDCSAKIGTTQISATPLHLETPSETKIKVTYKRPEGSGLPTDFIGLFVKDQPDNRRPVDFVIPTEDFGTVEFHAPQYDGVYQARYVGGELGDSLKARSVAIEVTKACLNGCSQHGLCNKGTCECLNAWGGVDCSIGQGPTSVTVGPKLGNPGDKLVISYIRPVNNGGANDFLAIYKENATDMTAPLAFVMATDNDHDTIESTMPTVEAVLEVHYVRGSDQTSMGHSSPFSVVFPCKDDCNSHGDCRMGFCTCFDGWDGFTCDKSVPTAFNLTCAVSTVDPLGNIPVAWQAIPRESNPSDYIGLFDANDPTGAPVAYEYTSLQPSGTCNLVAPYQVGQYIARYISTDSKTGVVSSKAEGTVVSVVKPPKTCPSNCNEHGTCNTATGDCACFAGWASINCGISVPTAWAVSANALEYGPGYWVEVSWTRPPVNDGNYLDMIGIFETGPTRKLQAIQFQYVGVGNEGKVLLQAPAVTAVRQTFALQFVNGATGKTMATSASFDVVKAMVAPAHKHIH